MFVYQWRIGIKKKKNKNTFVTIWHKLEFVKIEYVIYYYNNILLLRLLWNSLGESIFRSNIRIPYETPREFAYNMNVHVICQHDSSLAQTKSIRYFLLRESKVCFAFVRFFLYFPKRRDSTRYTVRGFVREFRSDRFQSATFFFPPDTA